MNRKNLFGLLGLIATTALAAMTLTALKAQWGMPAFWAFVALPMAALLELGILLRLNSVAVRSAKLSGKMEPILLAMLVVTGLLIVVAFGAAIVAAGSVWGIAASILMTALLALAVVTVALTS